MKFVEELFNYNQELRSKTLRGVWLPDIQLMYMPIPKVAGTSMLNVVYQGLYDKPFEPQEVDGRKLMIHDYFNLNFRMLARHQDVAGARKVAIVRDPIKRFLSGYTHRVIDHWALREKVLGNEVAASMKAPLNPGVNAFVHHLPEYLKVSTQILHHLRPFSFFLGTDLSVYDRIFPFEQLGDATRYFSDAFGKNLELPHVQKASKKTPLSALQRRFFYRLIEIYADDYLLLKDFYSIDAIVEEYENAPKT